MPASAAAILAEDKATLPEAPRRHRMGGGIAASIGLHLLTLLLIAGGLLQPPPPPTPDDLVLPVALVRLGPGAGGPPTMHSPATTHSPDTASQSPQPREAQPTPQATLPALQPTPAPPAPPSSTASSPPVPVAAEQRALAAAMTRPRDAAPARQPDPKAKTGTPLDSRRAATPADPLAARLQQLARLKSTALPQPPTASAAPAGGSAGTTAAAAGMGAGNNGAPSSRATAGVRDFLRAQVIRHWNLRTQPSQSADWTVSIHLQLRRDGSVVLAEIVDPARYRLNRPYFEFALSARNAVLLAAPLAIPPGQYDLVSDVVLPFSARDVLQ